MPNLQIRAATEDDVSVILELIQALAEYEKLTQTFNATEARLRDTLFGKHPAAEVLLAHSDGECAGYAVYFMTHSTFLAAAGLYLEDLYVKPDLRGKGIGVALLKHVASIAVERGCARMEWDVLDWNEPAIRFYKRLGAVPMDEWTKYRLSGNALRNVASSK